jgi:RNA polymerase sigma-70 factor, ECF subfamily
MHQSIDAGSSCDGLVTTARIDLLTSLARATDEELFLSYRSGCEQAFAELVRRYQRMILTVALRVTRDRRLSEDVAQETFLRLHRFASSFDRQKKLRPWLLQIAHNVASNVLRYHVRHRVKFLGALAELESAPVRDVAFGSHRLSAVDRIEQADMIPHLLRALDDLPADQKEVIVLGIFQDFSYAKMQEITGQRQGTLRIRMFLGLRRLSHTIGTM